MNLGDFKIHGIIAMFHKEEPVSYSVEEIRNQEDDYRYVIYVNYPGERFVIKFASNGFTTEERINGRVDLIAQHREMGYYSPSICKSVYKIMRSALN